MARKKKKANNLLTPEAKRTLYAIVLFLVAIFIVLGSLNVAGPAGLAVHKALMFLFGYGFIFVPVLAIAYGSYLFNFIESVDRKTIIGSILLIVSSLGLLSLAGEEAGGLIGKLIQNPLVKLLDIYVGAILLLGVFASSIVLVFNIPLSLNAFKVKLSSIFKKRTKEIDSDHEEDEYEEDYEEEEYEEDYEEEEKETSEPTITTNEEDEMFSGSFEFKEYTPPPLSLLAKDKGKPNVGDIKANSNIIKITLQNFGIEVEMDEITVGPTITRYAMKPAQGVKISRIIGLKNDLSLALAAHPIRIQAPIPGKALVGVEVPNKTKSMVGLGNLVATREFQESPKDLLVALGKGVSGKPQYTNIAKMPHLLIAGATGAGKSVTVHAIITSLLYRNGPANLRFIMVDPKRVELTLYNKIPHLLTPVIKEAKKAILALNWAIKEMERRYDILESEAVRDLQSYHKKFEEEKEAGIDDEEKGMERLPYIVIIIDEVADIMQTYPRELESGVVRLAQMSRAIGIHLILSTQRPSVNVVTGLIKANVPARLALQVASQVDSKTILDQSGAETLLGAGDMLYLSGDMSQPERIQCAFISEGEVKAVVKYLAKAYQDEVQEEIIFTKEQEGVRGSIFSSSVNDDDDDDLYEEARELVINTKKASTSYLQRKLKIGYSRAARLIDILEERGVVGPANGSKPRDVHEKADNEVEEYEEELEDESTEDYDQEEE
ncbi:MAG: S-DNA-T family DNA segregation ATPase FtsK/SpoIIIE [Candidatus Paceibacteria bacterium]|jgi:S-DNA-T family DNA segregation ATPase FtsK/SpoIIIE